ncbi:MAG: hypothetical protein J0G29_02470 [Alphaproteobacteria bacterium]|nr:hypothetical protein [Alphaproteobacteria bacterium]OJV45479.1 MAG: hypothetical protein BGO28_05130 [Alphaproteobacteria bacterium 43-37]
MQNLNTTSDFELNNRSGRGIQDNTRPLKHFKSIRNKKFGFSLDAMTDDEGTVWFVFDVVCYYLGLSTLKNPKETLNEAQTRVVTTGIYGGWKPITLVSEPGVYHLALRSHKPSAERFYEWVFEDALPSIRKASIDALLAQINAFNEEIRETKELLRARHEELIFCKFGADYIC